ncbi:MAG: stomatin 2 [Lysobacteraceae bacterium]|nr:MAG: stomatin 2 [Xanthomonadaceae bacterium]
MGFGELLGYGLAIVVVIAILKTARIVPQRAAFVVERLGKYSKTLSAGFHILVPFIDKVAYKLNLKETAIDVASQICITSDNIAVEIDGVLYLQVVDPANAAYGIEDYQYATTQLAQTTLRSVIGKIQLDQTFEERETINGKVVDALDEAAKPWGVKVLRYEISNIKPPPSVQDALEKQMRAERERRAVVAESEGEKEAKINVSLGERAEIINISEAEKQKQINEAEGKAKEIMLLAEATARGLERIAVAINQPGGENAVNLRIAEQYVKEFGRLADETNTLILPAELSNIGGAVAGLQKILQQGQTKN